jgi:hypothetical protein
VAEGWTIGGVDIRVVYFDGCPSWRTAKERLREALARMGRGDTPVALTLVETEADVRAGQFAGSPTILVDGRDLFPGAPVPDGLTCRPYSTSAGMAGSLTVDDLVGALEERGTS